jgi:chromate transport protein ChrA
MNFILEIIASAVVVFGAIIAYVSAKTGDGQRVVIGVTFLFAMILGWAVYERAQDLTRMRAALGAADGTVTLSEFCVLNPGERICAGR